MKKDTMVLKEMLDRDAKRIASSINFHNLSNKSILITGANGLIGINFIASLVEIATKISGIKIYLVIHSSLSLFLLPFLNARNVFVFKGDLTDDHFIETFPNVDIIIHTAGSGIPSQFLNNKLSTLKINTKTTLKLFEKLNIGGKFLFISSSDLYNGLDAEVCSENQIGTTNTDHPRACYIEGKRVGETICNIYQEMGVDAYSVRLSLTYGPGTSYDDSRVLPSFIRKALDGQIDLLDSGKASRTFCYISDAIELMWFVLLNGKHCLYNIGGNEKIEICNLAEMIGKILHVPVNYPAINSGIMGAPHNVEIDISRILLESKKNKFVSLKEGLANTINWFRLLKNMKH
ncbi:MAG: NAD-dependent epimerase/dehydratase family protein [Candidatus Zambryskibacteria bacterium]|nr:NAD-dependent epimerase/dehydratase family protein [Candidatus Zambryskibacteria bacterium]